MPTKTYTAQEMREAADTMDEYIKEMEDGNSMYWRDDHITSEDWKAMLRYAAEVVEENAKLKASKDRWIQYQETAAGERNACIDELRKKDAEIAELQRKYADACKCCDDAERRLKVAEDALGESRVAICHICDKKHMCGHGTAKFDPCCIYKDIDGALAATVEANK